MTEALFCQVKDGAVVRGPEPLPLHCDGVLNLRAAEDPRVFGWYPVSMVTVPEGQMLVDQRFVLVGDRVHQAGTLQPIPPYVPPVPQEVTETEFIRACVRAGIITAAEGEGYLGRGELPPIMAGALDQLPEPARTDARLKAIGSSSFSRNDEVFGALVAAGIATDADLDSVFRLAGSLT